LISGGGSALLPSPVAGVTLPALQELTSTLLACGATINEINCLRKHLEQLKGGQMARMASPSPTAALILSDVVGDPLDVIASGPAVPDPSTFAEAIAILERYGILNQVPKPIVQHLQRGVAGEIPETPKPGDTLFHHVSTTIVGSNRQAAMAGLEQANAEGFKAGILTTYLQGEASQVGRFLAAVGKQAALTGQPISRPACLIAGGETTVTLRGRGKGGRNQEIALAAVEDLSGLDQVALVTLATDGGDGPTDAAGAVVTGKTASRARALDMQPSIYLEQNNAYPFFETLGDLLKPGPTRTNVNDLAYIFTFPTNETNLISTENDATTRTDLPHLT
jgi:hydroxypyruvate reductase